LLQFLCGEIGKINFYKIYLLLNGFILLIETSPKVTKAKEFIYYVIGSLTESKVSPFYVFTVLIYP